MPGLFRDGIRIIAFGCGPPGVRQAYASTNTA